MVQRGVLSDSIGPVPSHVSGTITRLRWQPAGRLRIGATVVSLAVTILLPTGRGIGRSSNDAPNSDQLLHPPGFDDHDGSRAGLQRSLL